MTDKVKKILKWIGVGGIIGGCACLWISGAGDAGYAEELVGTAFGIFAMIGVLFGGKA